MHIRSALVILMISGFFGVHSFAAQMAESSYAATQFNEAVDASKEAAELGDWPKALKYSTASLTFAEELLANDPQQLAVLNYNQGFLFHKNNKYEESIQFLKTALRQFSKLYGEKGIELQPLVSQLASSLGQLKDKRSLRYFKRALALTEVHYGKASWEYGKLSIDRGVILSHHFSYRKGRKALERGRDIMLRLEGVGSHQAGWASFNLGKLALARKKWEAASEHLLKALENFELEGESSNQIELATHKLLVHIYSEQNKVALATRHCLDIGRMQPEQTDQEYLPVYAWQPEYPASALRSGKSGWAVIEFDVDKQGFVRSPRVVESSANVFGKISLEAALKLRYAPMFENGEAIVTKNIQHKMVYNLVIE